MQKRFRQDLNEYGTYIFIVFISFMIGMVFYNLVIEEGRLDRVSKIAEKQAEDFCIEQNFDGLTDIYIVGQIYYRIICYKIENYNFTTKDFDIYLKMFEYHQK